ICAIRALIIASVSRAIVMVPASTSFTNCLIMSFPRSRAESSFASRPSSTMLSSRPFSVVGVVAACGAACCGSAIASLHFVLQFAHFVFVLERLHQNLVELVITLKSAAQVGELGAQVEQLFQRLDLLGDIGRLEIVHALEAQVDADLARIRIL